MVYLSDQSRAQTRAIYRNMVLKYMLSTIFMKLHQRFLELGVKFEDTCQILQPTLLSM